MLDGATLRELRHRSGKIQAHVAAAAGIPASVLSAYERGRRQPGVEIAARIVDILGYRVQFVALADAERQARDLEQVLRLADALPYRPQPLQRAKR